MLRTVHTPQITDAGKFREWSDVVKKAWNTLLELEYSVELPDSSPEEANLLEYYQQVVKHLTPKTIVTEQGPVVLGLGILSK